MFDNPMTRKIAEFLVEIGLDVRRAKLEEDTFLPGIQIKTGAMLVDENRLSYPGDLLHEAGHLALAPSHLRPLLDDKVELPGFNMEVIEAGTIAWSYAAGLHLGLTPEEVFHEGYIREGLATLLSNYRYGVYLGANVLEDAGLTTTAANAARVGIEPYPRMARWVVD